MMTTWWSFNASIQTFSLFLQLTPLIWISFKIWPSIWIRRVATYSLTVSRISYVIQTAIPNIFLAPCCTYLLRLIKNLSKNKSLEFCLRDWLSIDHIHGVRMLFIFTEILLMYPQTLWIFRRMRVALNEGYLYLISNAKITWVLLI